MSHKSIVNGHPGTMYNGHFCLGQEMEICLKTDFSVADSFATPHDGLHFVISKRFLVKEECKIVTIGQ